MGFFSWVTSDINESISNKFSDRHTFTVYMLSPDGNHLKEDDYVGYGVFGGVDAFVHWMKWNAPDEIEEGDDEDAIRDKFFTGTRFDDTDGGRINCKYPLKFTTKPVKYESVAASKSCPDQGYFYDEDEENEDDY